MTIPVSFGQVAERSREGYIERVFEAQIGELPRLGWFAPAFGFVVKDATAKEVFVFAPVGTPSPGRSATRLFGRALSRPGERRWIACQVEDTDRLTGFAVDGEVAAERALYITRKMKGQIRAGLVSVALSSLELASINQLLGWPKDGVLRRDEAIGVGGAGVYYSIHKLYDRKTGHLRQEAIVLHKKDCSA